MILFRFFFITVLLLTVSSISLSASKSGISRDRVTAVYIFRLAEHIQWPNENKIKEYRIHLVDRSRNVADHLKAISKIRKLHGKPLIITRSRKAEAPVGAHLIFLSLKSSTDYKSVFEQVDDRNTLIISDNINDQRRVMINLLESDDNQINFEINKANILNQNLGINPDIILLGGTEIDVARLYRESQVSLKQQQQRVKGLEKKRSELEKTLTKISAESKLLAGKLKQQQLQLDKQKQKLGAQQQLIKQKETAVKAEQKRLNETEVRTLQQQKLIDKQALRIEQERDQLLTLRVENNQQQLTIKQQKKAVDAEKKRLKQAIAKTSQQQHTINKQRQQFEAERSRYQKLSAQSEQQQKLIKQQRQTVLQEQKKFIILTSEVEAREKALVIQEQKITERTAILTEQDEKIERQQNILDEQTQTIDMQKNILMLLSAAVILFLLMAIAIFRGYKAKQLAVTELIEQKELLEQSAEALAKARDDAEKANRSKSTFLANMSHELRTPLNAILGFSQLMQDNPSTPKHELEHLGIINRSGAHLLQLINDVLDMSKIEAGRLKLETNDFDLGEMLRDVSDMMRVRAHEMGLQLILDQSSSFPRFIHADSAKIRQIFTNLLSNSIKFTDSGNVTLKLDAEESENDELVLNCLVSDTGRGINPKDIERIFLPFEQLAESVMQKGTGLGLAITRQFVQMMNGKIHAESVLGQGSQFYFTLLVKKAEDDVVIKTSAEKRLVIGLESDQPEFRLLIVEDQLENQLLLRELLENVGFRLQVAENGKIAIEQFKQWKPHLIWMDRRMPVMNGEEATMAIRKLTGGDKVKIVALTASAFSGEKETIMAAGMDEYISKPFRSNELFDCMGRLLGVRYQYKEPETIAVLDETPAVALDAKALSELPSTFLNDLLEACESGDGYEAQVLIDSLEPEHQEKSVILARMVDGYLFDQLVSLVKAALAENE